MALNEHPDISKLRETIYRDITQFANEHDNIGSNFRDILEQRALKKALATTMLYYVNYAYDLGKKENDINSSYEQSQKEMNSYFDKALDKVLETGNDPMGLQSIIDSL